MNEASLNADIREIKGDVKLLLGHYQEIKGALATYDVRLKHGEGEFEGLKVRMEKVEDSMVSLDACKERHGSNRWLVGTIIACASMVIACLALFIPAKAKGLAITPEGGMSLIEMVQANWASWSAIAGGILVVVGVLARAADGIFPRWAAKPEAFKNGIVTVLCSLIGLVVAFIPGANMPWYAGVVVGLLAGGGVLGANVGYSAGQRAMVRRRGIKLTRDLEAANRARRGRGFSLLTPMIAILLVGLLGIGSLSCTAAQQQIQQGIWAQGGLGMSKCLLECGAPAVTTHIDYNEVSIDTTGMTDDLLSCLMTCTSKVGIPTIIASIISAVTDRDMVCDARLERRLVVTKRPGE